MKRAEEETMEAFLERRREENKKVQKKLRGSFLVMNEGMNRKQRAKVWKMKKKEKKDIGGKNDNA